MIKEIEVDRRRLVLDMPSAGIDRNTHIRAYYFRKFVIAYLRAHRTARPGDMVRAFNRVCGSRMSYRGGIGQIGVMAHGPQIIIERIPNQALYRLVRVAGRVAQITDPV